MIRRIINTTAILVALSAVGSGTAAYAQEAAPRSTVHGLSVGMHGSSTALTLIEDRSTSFGGGLGIAVGYGFNDRFALHSLTTGTFMSPSAQDGYILTHVDVEGRYSSAAGKAPGLPTRARR